jgi:hypothetical protein
MKARKSVMVMVVGGALALAPPAGADTVTLGSTAGTPNQTLCSAGIECTYVPFLNASVPGLWVPFDGTITSFSINSGSTGGTVTLRVLRPAAGGRYTGSGTSAAVTIAGGVQTATTSLAVRAGDLIGLENSNSAILFDTAGTLTTFTAYYQLPSLGDGASAPPSNIARDRRLLLSAVLTYTPPAAGGPSGGGGTSPPPVTECVVPKLRNLTVTRARAALTAAHCKLGKVKRVRDRRVKRGRVVSQAVPAKWRSDVGAKVDVKVSLGPPRKRH